MERIIEQGWNRKRVLKLLSGGFIDDGTKSIAIFTPANPGARKYDDFEERFTSSDERTNYNECKKLEKFLKQNNYRFIKAAGCFAGEKEPSYIVRNLSRSMVEKICKNTFQDSYIFGNVVDGKIENLEFYQTPGVHESGEVEDYVSRGAGDASKIIDTDPDEYAYTQIDKKSWINHFPHYDNDWDEFENKGKWRSELFESLLRSED